MPGTPRRAEQRRLERVTHPCTQVGAIAHEGRDRMWLVMEVEDEVAKPAVYRPSNDAVDERYAGDGHCDFRPVVRQRAQARSVAGRQDQGARGKDGQDVSSNTMSAPVRPSASRCFRSRLR